MDENFKSALENGIKGDTIAKIAETNLEKNYFPKQAAKYYVLLSNIGSPNTTVKFEVKFRDLLRNGLTTKQISDYINSNFSNMDRTDIMFFIRSISNTSKYENRLKLQQSKQLLYTKPNNN